MQKKTYNSGDSPVVTHLTTNPPVTSLSTAERTGSAIFLNLWSYVKCIFINACQIDELSADRRGMGYLCIDIATTTVESVKFKYPKRAHHIFHRIHR